MSEVVNHSFPHAAIVIPSFQAIGYLARCLEAALRQDYPSRFEVIVVDNGSDDGSRELAEATQGVLLVANDRNLGFAAACNQGARATQARYVAFLNNDAVAEPDWLRRLVAPLVEATDSRLICTGGILLEHDGERIDFGGAGAAFNGFAVNLGRGVEQGNWFVPADAPVLFACGGALAIDRAVFLEVGGFDERFFAYLEDVDLGWRLWVLGYEVRLIAAARAYHLKHATSSRMYGHHLRRLIERNALATIIKNYDAERLLQILPAALLLQARRIRDLTGGALDEDALPRLRGSGEQIEPIVAVPRDAMAPLLAVNDLLDSWAELWQERERIQRQRRRSDSEIIPLLETAWLPASPLVDYRLVQDQLVATLKLEGALRGARHRVLVITGDPIQPQMAGTAIRAVEIARTLSQTCSVTLVAPSCELELPGVRVVVIADEEELAALARDVEVAVVQGHTLRRYPWLTTSQLALVCDLYDPFYLGSLAQAGSSTAEAERVAADVAAVNEQLDMCDFFICASERQRDYWLGGLAARGRLTHAAYKHDPTLRSLIDVAPFGVPDTPPLHERPVLKGVHPAIAHDDQVILWGGGIWEWLDPLSAIRAVARLAPQYPKLRLFFMGVGHPASPVAGQLMAAQARELAAELGVLDLHVIFNDGWVPYAERGAFLLEADIGISAHFEHVETRYAFRTRLLDYIWAGLPMVVTGGDELAALVERAGLGYVVPPGDDHAMSDALAALLSRNNARAELQPRFAPAQQQLRWEQVLAPLIKFCAAPRLAPDTAARRKRMAGGVEAQLEHADFPSLSRRIRDLERTISSKNEHIQQLEALLQRIQSGRVMRLLRRLPR